MASVEDNGNIVFVRSSGGKVENVCHACRVPLKAGASVLTIDMDSVAFCLCPFHEGMLLEKLLTNFIKRVKRGSKIGFLGPLPKDSKLEEGIWAHE